MATTDRGQISYEAGVTPVAAAAMTDSGDHTIFTTTSKPWSQASGYEYVVAPYGLATGGAVTPAASGTDNLVDVAALTAYAFGMTGADSDTGMISVAADTDVTITRATASDTHIINSVTVDSTGSIAVVAGTDHTEFSETRGADGGPPLIPVGSIEIAQVRLTSNTDAAITAAEIYAVPGTHQERYDLPSYQVDPIRGKVTFSSALPLIHTGTVTKKVMAKVNTPIFSVQPNTRDWVPAAVSRSVSSRVNYDGTQPELGSPSYSNASFSASLGDGHTDPILSKVGQNLLFKFQQDKNKTAYQVTQGVLSLTRAYSVGGHPQGDFTITPTVSESVDFAS